jgi:hypothetical protein
MVWMFSIGVPISPENAVTNSKSFIKKTSEKFFTKNKTNRPSNNMHIFKYSRRTLDFQSNRRGLRRRPLSLKASLLVMFKVLAFFVCPLTARTILNAGNPDAKRLYDDLLSNYNKLVRPVVNTTDPLTVRIKLKLSQLIDVVSGVHIHKCILNLIRFHWHIKRYRSVRRVMVGISK